MPVTQLQAPAEALTGSRRVGQSADPLAELDAIAAAPGPQFVMVAGRRRVGQTTLLTHWAAKTGRPTFYWYAKQGDRQTLLANLARHVYAWEHRYRRRELALA